MGCKVEDAKRMVAEGAKRNAERDVIEREHGFAAPGDRPGLVGVADLVRTAIFAIQCGIACKDWDEVAEGQAMLHQADARLQVHGDTFVGRPRGQG